MSSHTKTTPLRLRGALLVALLAIGSTLAACERRPADPASPSTPSGTQGGGTGSGGTGGSTSTAPSTTMPPASAASR